MILHTLTSDPAVAQALGRRLALAEQERRRRQQGAGHLRRRLGSAWHWICMNPPVKASRAHA